MFFVVGRQLLRNESILTVDQLRGDPLLLQECGGKGRSLFQLAEQGFNVPEFLVVPWSVIRLLIQPILPTIKAHCATIVGDDEHSVRDVSTRIAVLISELSLDFKQSLFTACDTAFGDDYLVSVRSSGLEEDGSKYSYAGQFDSFLFVSKSNLIDRVINCVASLYSPRVIKYRLMHKQPMHDGMAVIIQRMLNAEKSGVAFSMNSAGNLNESVLVAGYGVGEGVVTDRSDTDTFYVERGTEKVIQSINKKLIRLDMKRGGGIEENKVDSCLVAKPVLRRDQVLAIVAIALKLEKLMSQPQDIEFALDDEGEIYFLQARPITTIDLSSINVFDNSNIIESYPGITLPLSFDFALQAYRGVFTAAAKMFELPDSFIAQNEHLFSNLLGYVQGRIYYQLHNARTILEEVLLSPKSQQAWREFIGLENLDWPIRRSSRTKQLRALRIFTRLFFQHKKSMSRVFEDFHRFYRDMSIFLSCIDQKSNLEIYTFYVMTAKELSASWAPTIVNDYFAMKIHSLYREQVTAIGFDDNIANDLLCGIEGMESELTLLKLLDLKQMVLSSPVLTDLFKEDEQRIWEYLNDDSSDRLRPDDEQQLCKGIESYLEHYSDRVLEELKLETPSLKMKPWLLIAMIKNQMNNGATVVSLKGRQRTIRQTAECQVAAELRYSPFRRVIFNTLLDRSRAAVKERENMRLNRARIYGRVKEIFLEVGRRMVTDALLDSPEDVFYLGLDDLKQYCEGNTQEAFFSKVYGEKQKQEGYSRTEMPDRLIFSGSIPNLRHYNQAIVTEDRNHFYGIGASKGTVESCARVIAHPDMDLKLNGEILITRMTDPGWIFLIAQSSGLVSEKGSLLSHTAIVGREFGIPTVVGVEGITRRVSTGMNVKINGDTGEVVVSNGCSEV